VGTVGAKHWLYSRLSADADKQAEDRLTHFSDQLPPEFFTGLVGEIYNPSKNRFENRRGARNEPLDTWVYAYAAALHPELRMHRWTKAQWDARELRILTAAGDARVRAASNDDAGPGQATPAPALPTPSARPRFTRGNRSQGVR
jgi:phage terminase large subunit GpA-like protein